MNFWQMGAVFFFFFFIMANVCSTWPEMLPDKNHCAFLMDAGHFAQF